MKKLFLTLALSLSALCAGAFEFDSINLNDPFFTVSQEIAKRGYFYNHELNCLQGDCQGTTIYLHINYIDVNKAGMLGQLIVRIPYHGSDADIFGCATTLLNVIYHQIPGSESEPTYQADPDGTKLILSQKDGFLILTYNTPFYKAPSTGK